MKTRGAREGYFIPRKGGTGG